MANQTGVSKAALNWSNITISSRAELGLDAHGLTPLRRWVGEE